MGVRVAVVWLGLGMSLDAIPQRPLRDELVGGQPPHTGWVCRVVASSVNARVVVVWCGSG